MARKKLTAQQWRASENPAELIEYIQGQASDRKLRLIACGACRHVLQFMEDERAHDAIQITERFADGAASQIELAQAHNLAFGFLNDNTMSWKPTKSAAAALQHATYTDISETVVRCLACAASAKSGEVGVAIDRGAYANSPNYEALVYKKEIRIMAQLVRDIVQNPFQPVDFNGKWRSRQVVTIARSIYENRKFDLLPDLRNALEAASCGNKAILEHCRPELRHVRGCWLLDLILQQELPNQ